MGESRVEVECGKWAFVGGEWSSTYSSELRSLFGESSSSLEGCEGGRWWGKEKERRAPLALSTPRDRGG